MHIFMCPCGKAIDNSHRGREREKCKEERDVMKEMREIDVRDMKKFGTLLYIVARKTIAVLADSWGPLAAKQEGD